MHKCVRLGKVVEAAREREISFKPVENIRDAAKALLAKTEANKLIKLCQSESAPRVSFETAERSAATTARVT